MPDLPTGTVPLFFPGISGGGQRIARGSVRFASSYVSGRIETRAPGIRRWEVRAAAMPAALARRDAQTPRRIRP